MENELIFNTSQIIVTQGLVKFTEYEKIKNQALQLASQIKTVQVSEENIKESKKLLAAVNKRCKDLEDERIRIKKMMLEPYQEFEDQVKEIVAIVKEADNEVRQQVKTLEEAERFAKELELSDIFQKRIQHYPFKNLFSFKDFLKPKHLNKTTSLEAVEKEMIDYLEGIEKDMKVIVMMPNADDILYHYTETKDFATAIEKTNEDLERKRKIENAAIKKQPAENLIAFLVTVKVYSQKELKLLEMILQENEFEFMTDRIEN